MYVSAAKDGTITLWDGVSANCIRSIVAAHTAAEITSANFTKDQMYCRAKAWKDSAVKLWDVGTGRLVKQYSGSTNAATMSGMTPKPCSFYLFIPSTYEEKPIANCGVQAVFNYTEEFVLSIDEPSNEIVIWDAQTTERVAKLPSTHNGAPNWIEHSPIEAAFVCGNDRAVRYWRERI
ncbi:hypothetical protein MLD38_029062 [Melastoma candidum]|uniref:Uncharacterized protein n=1 Tax=Melastoma candidum TaxID=119954 RepID=A0ACB9N4A6_9MYRT|nr:hypothetical protein MLD38_029062 [Melastoma candidum]